MEKETILHPVDHIGIAVDNIQEALDIYTSLLSYNIIHEEQILDQNVNVVFIKNNNSVLELLSPIDSNIPSPISKFILNKGPGLHHICYRINDIQAELKKLAGNGVILVDKVPRKGAFNSKIAFLHPKSFNGVLIELCERNVDLTS